MTTVTPPTGRDRKPAAQGGLRAAPSTAPAHTPEAACTTADGDLFFPMGGKREVREQEEQAKQICGSCPVRAACLSWALENREDEGVWGGTTADERRGMHGRRPRYAFRRSAAAYIMTHRLGEYRELMGQNLPVLEVAKRLGTNVQTVNSVGKRLALLEWAKEVQAA
ncbi:WhiB family transcriptional regulator [Streptomyces sp. NPDC002623]